MDFVAVCVLLSYSCQHDYDQSLEVALCFWEKKSKPLIPVSYGKQP